MKKVIEKLELYKKGLSIITGILALLWFAFSLYNNTTNTLNIIQKTTLRTMIWSEGIPMRDKLESCDTYLKLGYNSETKRYCEKLIEKEFEDGD